MSQHSTAEWAAQQIINAFSYEEAPKYLLRDNDSIYGQLFRDRIKSLGMEEITTAYRSPWQSTYCERVIGTIRRECLKHLVVLSEAHLRLILSRYIDYYHTARSHLNFDRNSPHEREIESPKEGPVRSISVGGLHHRYTCRAA